MAKTADVLFILDTTGSMQFAINAMKQCIADVAQAYLTSRINIQVGLLEFRDRTITSGRDEAGLSTRRLIRFEGNDFTSDLNLFRNELNRLVAEGGGPHPESSFDALSLAVDANWRSNAHSVLILITDAPPHIPDFEIKTSEQLISRLNEGAFNQIHIVCPNNDMESFSQLAEVHGPDGDEGAKFLDLFFHELSVEQGKTEKLAETLRVVAKTSSDSIGSDTTGAPVLKERKSINPFDSKTETEEPESEDSEAGEPDVSEASGSKEKLESEELPQKESEPNIFDDY